MASRHTFKTIGALLMTWAIPNFAYAQATDIHQTISWIVTWAIGALNLGIWIVFTILLQLLDTSTFLGDGMIATLNQVWQLARNLVNIIFAFVLIGTAVYTVVTTNKDFIAEHMKKFVLAIILVNFSWFIPRVIIDVGNIAAATIFDIPSLVDTAGIQCTYRSTTQVSLDGEDPNVVCPQTNPPTDPPQYNCACAAVIDAKFFLSTEEADDLLPSEGWTPILAETMYIRLTNLNNIENAAPSSTILNGLIINHARLMGLASVPPSVQNDEVKSLIMFLLKEAIVLLLHAALFFPLVAMMVAFAIRIPVLWLTIAFMPFMVLQFVLPEKFTEGYPEKIWEHFLKAAFLPAIVAIPLTVGFVMINAGQAAGVLDNLQGIDFKLTGNMSDYQQLLWLIMTIGIIWTGVFSALEKMGVMGMGSQMIKGAGEGLGKFAVKTPLSIPFIPLPGGGSTSLLNAGRAAANIGSADNPNDLFASLRNNNVNRTQQPAANAKLYEEAKKMDELNESVKKLTDVMKDPDKTKRDAGFKTFKNEHPTIQIDSNNPAESLRPLLAEIKKNPSADAAKTTLLEQRLGELETEFKKP